MADMYDLDGLERYLNEVGDSNCFNEDVVNKHVEIIRTLSEYFQADEQQKRHVRRLFSLCSWLRNNCSRLNIAEIFYDKFSELTAMVISFLCYFDIDLEFAQDITLSWALFSENVPLRVKSQAMEERKNYFVEVIKFMAAAGHYELQDSLMDVLILYSGIMTDDTNIPLLVELFHEAGFDAEHLLRNFPNHEKKKEQRRFLNEFNAQCPQKTVTSFAIESIIFGELPLTDIFENKLWVDFQNATRTILLTFDASSLDRREDNNLVRAEFGMEDYRKVVFDENGDEVEIAFKLESCPKLLLEQHLSDNVDDVDEILFKVDMETAEKMAMIMYEWQNYEEIEEDSPELEDSRKDAKPKSNPLQDDSDDSDKENLAPNEQSLFLKELYHVVEDSHAWKNVDTSDVNVAEPKEYDRILQEWDCEEIGRESRTPSNHSECYDLGAERDEDHLDLLEITCNEERNLAAAHFERSIDSKGNESESPKSSASFGIKAAQSKNASVKRKYSTELQWDAFSNGGEEFPSEKTPLPGTAKVSSLGLTNIDEDGLVPMKKSKKFVVANRAEKLEADKPPSALLKTTSDFQAKIPSKVIVSKEAAPPKTRKVIPKIQSSPKPKRGERPKEAAISEKIGLAPKSQNISKRKEVPTLPKKNRGRAGSTFSQLVKQAHEQIVQKYRETGPNNNKFFKRK